MLFTGQQSDRPYYVSLLAREAAVDLKYFSLNCITIVRYFYYRLEINYDDDDDDVISIVGQLSVVWLAR